MKEKELQIVSFEQAKRLAEIGFDWKSEKKYGRLSHRYNYDIMPIGQFSVPSCKVEYSAPTVSLALKWFRDVKGKFGYVLNTCRYNFYYYTEGGGVNAYKTYELAESALLDELINLIEEEK